jgi:hypothetical protein
MGYRQLHVLSVSLFSLCIMAQHNLMRCSYVSVCRRLRKWYEEFQMWTLTAKAAPAPLKHNPKVSSSPAAAAAAAASRPQQPLGDAAAAAAAGGGPQPTEFAGFDQGLGPLEYVLEAAQQYFGKLPSLTSFTVDDWLPALLDSMGLDGGVGGRNPALLLIQVSHGLCMQLSCLVAVHEGVRQLSCSGGTQTLRCSCAHSI